MFDIIKLKKNLNLNKFFKKKNILISSIGTVKKNTDNSLIFVSKKKFSLDIIKNQKAIILTNIKDKKKSKNIIFSKNPRLMFCKILNYIYKNNLVKAVPIIGKISNSAKIATSAIIGKNVIIGAKTIIENNVIVENNTIIGKNCRIKEGSKIGVDGFAFERDKNKTYNFPFFGNTIIQDNVEVGVNTSISRANFGSTIIEKNTKIDAFVQIAHNVSIGKNCTITACCQIGGSSKIGHNVWLSPGSNIINNVNLGDNCFVGIGSVVIKNVNKNTKVFGNPARKI
jgi:UDP-3-O-[3-hydroxymyristoyl] glucosamine N-acyltransferase